MKGTGQNIISKYVNAAVERLSDSGINQSEENVIKVAEQLIDSDVTRAALNKQAALVDQIGRSFAHSV